MPAPRPSPRLGPIRVISADAQPMFRDALARAIHQDRKLELVAEAEDVEQLSSAIRRLAPDVAVVEAEMLEPLPPEWETGATRLLLLATEVSPEEAYDAIAQGAAGYLSKDAESPAIRRAIAAVARGETVLDRSAQTGIAKEIRLRTRDDRPELSSREQEILVLIAEGQTAPQIARRLHLSTATVKTHLLHLADGTGWCRAADGLLRDETRRGGNDKSHGGGAGAPRHPRQRRRADVHRDPDD
jgi:two-component system nitrate/nitrite response regulator NarL